MLLLQVLISQTEGDAKTLQRGKFTHRFADWLISKDVAVFAPHRHHHWLSAELSCQPLQNGFFRLLPLVSGTICRSTSRLQNLCLSSTVASRLISLSAAFCDILTVVVPEKWLCHSGHVNRFCYLLTYLHSPGPADTWEWPSPMQSFSSLEVVESACLSSELQMITDTASFTFLLHHVCRWRLVTWGCRRCAGHVFSLSVSSHFATVWLVSRWDSLFLVGCQRHEMGCKLVLFTNMKLHTGFWLVPTSMTLNDTEQRNDRWRALSLQ